MRDEHRKEMVLDLLRQACAWSPPIAALIARAVLLDPKHELAGEITKRIAHETLDAARQKIADETAASDAERRE